MEDKTLRQLDDEMQVEYMQRWKMKKEIKIMLRQVKKILRKDKCTKYDLDILKTSLEIWLESDT